MTWTDATIHVIIFSLNLYIVFYFCLALYSYSIVGYIVLIVFILCYVWQLYVANIDALIYKKTNPLRKGDADFDP